MGPHFHHIWKIKLDSSKDWLVFKVDVTDSPFLLGWVNHIRLNYILGYHTTYVCTPQALQLRDETMAILRMAVEHWLQILSLASEFFTWRLISQKSAVEFYIDISTFSHKQFVCSKMISKEVKLEYKSTLFLEKPTLWFFCHLNKFEDLWDTARKKCSIKLKHVNCVFDTIWYDNIYHSGSLSQDHHVTSSMNWFKW